MKQRIGFLVWTLVLSIVMSVAIDSATPRRRDTLGHRHTVDRTAVKGSEVLSVADRLDTVTAGCDTLLTIADFAKPLRSRIETMRLTNHGDGRLAAAVVTIRYTAVDGTPLTVRQLRLPLDLPAGETRMHDFPSFDRQQRFRHRNSPAPRRAESQVFDVSIGIDSLFYYSNPVTQ